MWQREVITQRSTAPGLSPTARLAPSARHVGLTRLDLSPRLACASARQHLGACGMPAPRLASSSTCPQPGATPARLQSLNSARLQPSLPPAQLAFSSARFHSSSARLTQLRQPLAPATRIWEALEAASAFKAPVPWRWWRGAAGKPLSRSTARVGDLRLSGQLS